jgi:hypothetical protein
MTGSLQEQVVSFVAQERCAPQHRVRMDSTICGELGVDGDDAAELIEEFAKHFSVDLSGYDHKRYFGPEGFNPFAMLWVLLLQLLGRTPEQAAGLCPLTVGDLVAAAAAGRWIKHEV